MSFYCGKDKDFSIDEWNRKFELGCKMGLSEIEMNKFLNKEPCNEQCFDCMVIVNETRIKNSKL